MKTPGVCKAISFKSVAIAAVLLSAFTANVAPSSIAHASPTEWNSGRIIDNGVFTNKDSMSASNIQAFLNSKVPVCDTYGTQQSEYGGGTRAQWGQANYGQSTFVCLKDASENGISAAQIIYNVAQKYKINPQVLIVLLQKEQGLVTDTWPLNIQYRSATGYGCPDTAPCDSQYYGLTNQLDWSGKMFRAILDASPTWFTPYILGSNYIRYSPDASCGGSTVNIQNRATQALYNYTPYQPNAAALAAALGTKVDCGAYGNINFFRYFTSWFGTTQDPTFAWVNMGAKVYTDSTKSRTADLSKVSTGNRLYLVVRALNTGNVAWSNTGNYPVRLGTWGPQDRQSSFCDASWSSCDRAATLREPSVAPGQIGSFEFWLSVPEETDPGHIFEGLNPVAENASWFSGDGFQVQFTVIPTLSAAITSKDAFTDSTKLTLISTASLVSGQRFYVSIKARNTGNVIWTNSGSNPVKLGTLGPQDSSSPFCDYSTWASPSCNRPATLQESIVSPGDSGTFEFWVTSPSRTGFYTAYYSLLSEGYSWFRNTSFYMNNIVSVPVYAWQTVSLQAFSDSGRSTEMPPGNLYLNPGQKAYIRLVARNSGNIIWKNTGPDITKLGTWNERDHISPLCDISWSACNRPAILNESYVLPGQTGTFEFILNGPIYRGNHLEFYNLVTEGRAWLNNSTVFYRVIN